MTKDTSQDRNVVFISKATPGDDEFVLWLAPRLEAAGYTVFADILTLEPGDRWRKVVTGTLQNDAIKMLLCCRDATLQKDGVQEEIGIALDLAKELKDPRFIIPLRLEKYKKLFGIGELQYIDFVGSWASGLRDVLDALEKQDVPRSDKAEINSSWEAYKKRLAIQVQHSPEVLTTNWIRVASVPNKIRYYQPNGSLNYPLMEQTCKTNKAPAEPYLRGFFSFSAPEEIEQQFESVGRFAQHSEYDFDKFLEEGSRSPDIRPREAKNLASSMFRRAWENFCSEKGLYAYQFSNQLGFHITEDLVPIGKRIPWGKQGQRRSSMLCNSASGKVWQYGISAMPNFWPFAHFKMKSRVLFAELAGKKAGKVFEDAEQQHRLRRSVCKGWRNKAWHGRLMAFMELLSGDSPYIDLPVAEGLAIRLEVSPMLVTSPVTTILPDAMPDDAEEEDVSTLGNFNIEDDE